MAMDKEKLLAFFQAHYLSRQEVLYKLPLNYSIDTFWVELLNRRKAGATVLPLYNASGMPYWYVLTDAMVAASERLCEEAFVQTDGIIDPYRAQMTSAMTEEMFFTSFVEGAQIPLQEAMDFLQRGTEPENIQEQMIWNNRHAWAELVATLYRPLDEPMIKSLAYMLTEEMDGCAEDYRQADKHPIAAMNNELYDVPPSCTLPDRMRDYCAFLQKPDVHPLIKAAVAQAYILVARPFPEGNERLSRMLSSAVLLRCGYDFFRDISLSAVIARESYRYYKSMREIIRAENGGDLTYFMEYFLELLARAIDDRKERLRRREQDTLEKEREMARQPLRPEPSDITNEPHAMNQARAAIMPTDPEPTDPKEIQLTPLQREESHPEKPKLLPLEAFLDRVDTLYLGSKRLRKSEIPQRIRSLLNQGVTSFNTQEWSGFWHIGDKSSSTCCNGMMEKGLVSRALVGRKYTYTFLVDPASVNSANPEHEEPEFGLPDDSITKIPDSIIVPGTEVSDDMLVLLREMQNSGESRKRRIGSTLISFLDEGKSTFSYNDWKHSAQVSRSVCTDDLRRAVSIGLIHKGISRASGNQKVYTISVDPPRSGCILSALTIAEQHYLAMIYSQYGNQGFITDECAEILGLTKNRTVTYLEGFQARGIMDRRREGRNLPYTYCLLITPNDHPECFATLVSQPHIRPGKFRHDMVNRSTVAL